MSVKYSKTTINGCKNLVRFPQHISSESFEQIDITFEQKKKLNRRTKRCKSFEQKDVKTSNKINYINKAKIMKEWMCEKNTCQIIVNLFVY